MGLSIKKTLNTLDGSPVFHVQREEQGYAVVIAGHWKAMTILSIKPFVLEALAKLNAQPVSVLIEDETVMDTAGFWFVRQALEKLNISKFTAQPDLEKKLLAPIAPFPSLQDPSEEKNWIDAALTFTGFRAYDMLCETRDVLAFLGESVYTLLRSFFVKDGIRIASIFHYFQLTGIRALPIVGLISFLIGTVLAYQGINQLKQFGAEIYTVNFVGVSILRELGVLLTSIVVAGRSASSFAAQIGTMKLNEEIDVLRVMKINPIGVLVLPRLIALFFALPMLVFWSDIMALLGGMFMMRLIIDLSPGAYFDLLNQAITVSHFWVGMVKAPLFAILIAMVGCYRGMKVEVSAESVGFMTTQAVVEAIFMIIVCDAFMSILFSYLEI